MARSRSLSELIEVSSRSNRGAPVSGPMQQMPGGELDTHSGAGAAQGAALNYAQQAGMKIMSKPAASAVAAPAASSAVPAAAGAGAAGGGVLGGAVGAGGGAAGAMGGAATTVASTGATATGAAGTTSSLWSLLLA